VATVRASAQRKRVNVTAFTDDFVGGASEEELRRKYALTRSQLTRLVGVLRERGRITASQEAQRTENLTIRFGAPEGPPAPAPAQGAAVDFNSGMVLHCPTCGAPIERGTKECEYCRAPLDFSLKGKTIMCPYCFEQTPADGGFCMRCARPIKDVVEKGEVLPDHQCPRCRVPMQGMRIGDYSVVECSRCHGLFVSHETFELMQDHSTRIVEAAHETNRTAVQPETQFHYIRCPVCRQMMNRQNFARVSGVIIDICRDHGIWFDSGELEKIMDFIARGGLRKAREAEIERLKAEEQLQQLRNSPQGSSMRTSFPMGPQDELMMGTGLMHVIGAIFHAFKK
jgi:Zn-finger nucleic acid-binding protein